MTGKARFPGMRCPRCQGRGRAVFEKGRRHLECRGCGWSGYVEVVVENGMLTSRTVGLEDGYNRGEEERR